VKQESAVINFVGARKGATGTLEDLKDIPPIPKAWVKPSIVLPVIDRLKSGQLHHTRLDLHSIIINHFYDAGKDRSGLVWSKYMISSVGVSYIDDPGVYYSLNLSRLDLRGINMHSGDDRRTAVYKDRNVNFQKDERTDLRGMGPSAR
jgi:hypothetical protein